MKIWQTFYRFELVSGEGRFRSNYNCCATNISAAWVQVAAATQGHSPYIEAINLISTDTLYNKTDEEILELLRTIRNH